jgi:hypothetical protein
MTNNKQLNDVLFQILKDYLDQNPTIRFTQALYNLEFIQSSIETPDHYYDENGVTLERVMGFGDLKGKSENDT